MTLSSKHVANYAFGLMLLGLVVWMSSSLLFPHHKPAIVGTVEVTALGN